eukprot:TRINITY_DN7938_c0_g1_i6.p1 TRINITY_DN7938_c0_g1~~TRINITY_DN7938_c0_g1_i6.p1  ORF type:complete len:1151 (-),score=204.67 TRINITY_DN7938_c0_g1_i6:209-3535(-)
MVYCFLGVSIVADTFMGAIEAVTSRRRQVTLPNGAIVTVKVWNDTVANLTLMALGSSVWSVFAYLWLVVILQIITPDEVEPWEAVATLLFLILLVWMSLLADTGMLQRLLRLDRSSRRAKQEAESNVTRLCETLGYDDPVGRFEVQRAVSANCRLQVVEHASKTELEELHNMVFSARATARVRDLLRREARGAWKRGLPICGEDPRPVNTGMPICVQFLCTEQCMSRDVAQKSIVIERSGDQSVSIDVKYALYLVKSTPCGRARIRDEKEVFMGVARFREFEKRTNILIARPKVPEGYSESFAVRLVSAEVDCGDCPTIGEKNLANVNIVPSNSPGRLCFACDQLQVQGSEESQRLEVIVMRTGGCSKSISCNYRTEGLSAISGWDFEETEGTLEFAEGVTEQAIWLTVLPKGAHKVTDKFLVILDGPDGGAALEDVLSAELPEEVFMTVVVCGQDKQESKRAKMSRCIDWCINLDELSAGHAAWRKQIPAALYCNGDNEAQAEATKMDWFFHILGLPWKLFFTLIPPTKYFGGWACFFFALVHIALITAVLGDLAELFGCVVGVPNSVTAISFVALGTSMPDLFASQAAAAQDDWADASICNVTGSNSVNVFLGLGLPWTMAAMYWSFAEWDVAWADRYDSIIQKRGLGKDGAMTFVVPAGGLVFSVVVFTATSVVALFILNLRRRCLGNELGGPFRPKMAAAVTFSVLWMTYIMLATWQATSKDMSNLVPPIVSIVLVGLTTVITTFFTLKHSGWGDEPEDTDGVVDDRGPDCSPISLEELLQTSLPLVCGDTGHTECEHTTPEPRSCQEVQTDVQKEVLNGNGEVAVCFEPLKPTNHVTDQLEQQPLPQEAQVKPVVLEAAPPNEPAASSTAPAPTPPATAPQGEATAVAPPMPAVPAIPVVLADTTTSVPVPAVLVNRPNTTRVVATMAQHALGGWCPAQERHATTVEQEAAHLAAAAAAHAAAAAAAAANLPACTEGNTPAVSSTAPPSGDVAQSLALATTTAFAAAAGSQPPASVRDTPAPAAATGNVTYINVSPVSTMPAAATSPEPAGFTVIHLHGGSPEKGGLAQSPKRFTNKPGARGPSSRTNGGVETAPAPKALLFL